MTSMPKVKTSVNIDDQVWKRWLLFVINKTGTSRKVSEETAKALEEYMEKHKET